MKDFELIAEAIEMMNAGNNEVAIARLKQFTALNTPKVKSGGKLKIYDWVGKQSYRPALTGVFHDTDNQVAVATDEHVLIVSKIDFNESNASQIIDKKGDVVKGGIYPKYERVIPNHEHMQQIEIDREKIATLLSEMRAERKIDKSIDYSAFNVAKDGKPFYIAPKNCKLLLTLPADGKFYITEPCRPMLYKSEDYTAVIMPIMVKDEFIGQDKVPFHYC